MNPSRSAVRQLLRRDYEQARHSQLGDDDDGLVASPRDRQLSIGLIVRRQPPGYAGPVRNSLTLSDSRGGQADRDVLEGGLPVS
jgi:hypothetical protein